MDKGEKMPQINDAFDSPNQSGRNGKTPQLIVCHVCDGTYEGTKAWFANKAAETSSHYIVAQDGRICQCVPLERAAWCNGTSAVSADARFYGHSTLPAIKKLGGNANEYSVSVECEGVYSKTQGELTDAQLEALAWLIKRIKAEIKRVYGHEIILSRENVVGHCEVTPKTRPNCPGQKFQWDRLMPLLGEGTPAAGKALYRVQVGAFGEKANADAMLRQLKEKGFEGFIAEEKQKEG
jgi:N-acetyl-anhydromuramyl-L-alanine amidase AmpD